MWLECGKAREGERKREDRQEGERGGPNTIYVPAAEAVRSLGRARRTAETVCTAGRATCTMRAVASPPVMLLSGVS